MYHPTLDSTKMTTTMINIVALPRDVIYYILQFLNMQIQFNFAVSCKAFYEYYVAYPVSILYGSNVPTYTFRCYPPMYIESLQYFMNLIKGPQYQIWKFDSMQVTPDSNKQYTPKSLVLTQDSALPDEFEYKNINALAISFYESGDDESRDDECFTKPVPIPSTLLERFGCLTSLVIHGFDLNGNIDHLIVGMPDLKYFWIQNCTNGDGLGLDLSTMFVGCTNLIELYLTENLIEILCLRLPPDLQTLVCCQRDKKIRRIDASLCRKLQYLEVHSCRSIQEFNDGLTFIPPLAPCLHVLKFYCCYLDVKATSISAFENLEELTFDMDDSLDMDESYWLDFSHMTSLQRLNIGLDLDVNLTCKFPPGKGLVYVKLMWEGYDNNSVVQEIQLGLQPIERKLSQTKSSADHTGLSCLREISPFSLNSDEEDWTTQN